MVSRNHDRTKLTGETLWAGAREIKGTTYLIGAVGIFEQSRDQLREIETGNIGGFSLTVSKCVNIEDANWDTDRADVQIRYKAEEFEAVHKIAESLDIPIRIRTQKSTEGRLITDAIVQNSVAIFQLIISFWQLHEDMKDDELSEDHESEQSNLTITVSGNVVINSK